MAQLLKPYIIGQTVPEDVVERCRVYLDLLLRWNRKTNLTAIRNPEQLVQRQIGESLFAGRFLKEGESMLDFGSGAGFPGIPLQLLHTGLAITLAESQGKKASFLREAVRTLQLPCKVWSGRVEDMPSEVQFDAVIMRAVDNSAAMLDLAIAKVRPNGRLLRYLALNQLAEVAGWECEVDTPVPDAGRLVIMRRRFACSTWNMLS